MGDLHGGAQDRGAVIEPVREPSAARRAPNRMATRCTALLAALLAVAAADAGGRRRGDGATRGVYQQRPPTAGWCCRPADRRRRDRSAAGRSRRGSGGRARAQRASPARARRWPSASSAASSASRRHADALEAERLRMPPRRGAPRADAGRAEAAREPAMLSTCRAGCRGIGAPVRPPRRSDASRPPQRPRWPGTGSDRATVAAPHRPAATCEDFRSTRGARHDRVDEPLHGADRRPRAHAAFYADGLGLQAGARARPSAFPARGCTPADGRSCTSSPGASCPHQRAGVLDHMAFSATGLKGVKPQLDGDGRAVRPAPSRRARSWQLFCHDPSGAKVELDFDPAKRLTDRPVRSGADEPRDRRRREPDLARGGDDLAPGHRVDRRCRSRAARPCARAPARRRSLRGRAPAAGGDAV